MRPIIKMEGQKMDTRRLKRRRRALGFSQAQLAERLGIPRSEVSEMESGKRVVAARGVTLDEYERLIEQLEAEDAAGQSYEALLDQLEAEREAVVS